MTDRRRAFRVVDEFEAALCEYTGAKYAVTTDSCTNALFLALCWERMGDEDFPDMVLPKHTYVGVVQAARNAGYNPRFTLDRWEGHYRLNYTQVVDSAKHFQRDMYVPTFFTCVSFQAGKILPIGRGGAILHDNPEADEWFRRARLDGRTAGADYADNTYQQFGSHCYMTPPDAARGLWLLTYADDGPDDTWESYPDLSEATWT